MSSILDTDGYKFSMAQAGAPLRHETFYLSFRKGGWQYLPFDLEAEIRSMLPELPDVLEGHHNFLNEHGYGLTGAMIEALKGEITIEAVPADTWVYEREPIVTISGPSFLVSWLEPLVLRLFFPIQLATEIMRHPAAFAPGRVGAVRATCEEQADVMRRVMETLKASTFPAKVMVKPEEYFDSVALQAKKLLAVVKDPSRIFEVGMRAATCEGQHRIVLEALREHGITATSNVALAYEQKGKPVGTMGHEHIQRWGNDLDAFRAMRDMRGGVPSYLPDTFDTISSGIPAMIQVMLEQPHEGAIRYDSGDKYGQYIYAHGQFVRNGLTPTHILEDGLTVEMTAKFEQLREFTGLSPEKQVYGYGGALVSRHWPNPLTRDAVAAVYKLTQTSGEPRMKFGDEAGLGKVSVPGHPVAWRRLRGEGPLSMIGQAGERVAEDYTALNGNPEALNQLKTCNVRCEGPQPYTLSPETQRLVDTLRRNHG